MDIGTRKGNGTRTTVIGGAHGERPTILVVTKHPSFTPEAMDHAMAIAERLRGDLFAAFVDTLPEYFEADETGAHLHPALFAERAEKSARDFHDRAVERGLRFRSVVAAGRPDKAVSTICTTAIAIDLVLVESDIQSDRIAAAVPVPVFSLALPRRPAADTGRRRPAIQEESGAGSARRLGSISRNRRYEGERFMANARRKQAAAKAAIFGIVSVALYAAVFTWSSTIMTYFTKGGMYCMLPVATVFLFSYVHGSFTGNFWTALGIEASAKLGKTEAAKKAPARQRDSRPRIYAS